MKFSVAVQTQDFSIADEYSTLIDDKSIGAVVFFVGLVRDMNLARDVVQLRLEHYPGMTEKSLMQILDEARQRWQLQAARIVHRVGDLNLGDQIVYVGVASAHRSDAFLACEFLMDYLKTRAPFWKKELTSEGEIWLEAQVKDEEAAKRWE
jgi:molybdopterin synthase catalytic subunit